MARFAINIAAEGDVDNGWIVVAKDCTDAFTVLRRQYPEITDALCSVEIDDGNCWIGDNLFE